MPITPSSGSIRIARARQQIHRARVGHEHHGLEPAQRAVRAPVPRQFDRGALEVAAMLFELALESPEQRKAVGRRTGKSGQHTVVVQPPDLPRLMFDDGLAERDLAVAGQNDFALMPNAKHRRGVRWRRIDRIVVLSAEQGKQGDTRGFGGLRAK